MPVRKRQYESGTVVWSYYFSGPGATRQNRHQCTETGFKTKKEAQDAESARRVEEQKKYELAKQGAPVEVTAELPKTLSDLLREFLKQHAEENLSPKTVERYRESVAYLSAELTAMPIAEITPLHLNREWKRLLKSGGHTRKGIARLMHPKTVRNVCGVVSSAFGRAVTWGLLQVNPCTKSEPPKVQKRKKTSLTTGQQDLLIDAARGPWCLPVYLEVDAACGARRGEVLALRWADIENGRATIARSLCQTYREVEKPGGKKVKVHDVLTFKTTKTENIRVVGLPGAALAALEDHRKKQDEFRKQFGAAYRADLDLIFANPDGTPLKPDSISATVSALFKRLKIPKPKGVALHLLRHSHGSHLLAEGVPLPAVSARLGHDSVRTTAEIYAHEIHGQDDQAVQAWESHQQKNRQDRRGSRAS